MRDRSQVIFSTPEARDLLLENGLGDLESVSKRGKPLLFGRHEHKEVTRVEVSGSAGPEDLFVKRQWRPARRFPRLGDILRGRGWRPDPVNEWIGLREMRAIGLDAAEPLALFYRPRSFQAAVVVRSVPGTLSLREMIREGHLERMSEPEREALVASLTSTVRRLHESGYAWRGIVPKHFYPERAEHGTYRVWMIDCEGVHRAFTQQAPRRDRRKLTSLLRKEGAPDHFVQLVEERMGV